MKWIIQAAEALDPQDLYVIQVIYSGDVIGYLSKTKYSGTYWAIETDPNFMMKKYAARRDTYEACQRYIRTHGSIPKAIIIYDHDIEVGTFIDVDDPIISHRVPGNKRSFGSPMVGFVNLDLKVVSADESWYASRAIDVLRADSYGNMKEAIPDFNKFEMFFYGMPELAKYMFEKYSVADFIPDGIEPFVEAELDYFIEYIQDSHRRNPDRTYYAAKEFVSRLPDHIANEIYEAIPQLLEDIPVGREAYYRPLGE